MTMCPFDPRAFLINGIEKGAARLSSDLRAIPTTVATTSSAAGVRTAVNIVAECGVLSGYLADKIIDHGYSADHDELVSTTGKYDTVESALQCLTDNTNKLVTAIKALDEHSLQTDVELFGRQWSLFELCALNISHLSYHDGQLNYIQTLHGDGENHWG